MTTSDQRLKRAIDPPIGDGAKLAQALNPKNRAQPPRGSVGSGWRELGTIDGFPSRDELMDFLGSKLPPEDFQRMLISEMDEEGDEFVFRIQGKNVIGRVKVVCPVDVI